MIFRSTLACGTVAALFACVACRPPARAQEKLAAGNEPKLLVAPFGAEESLAARKAWAAYRRIEPERKNSIGMQLTLVPAGEFQMGSDESDANASSSEKPQHRVRITQPFYLGTYEVTKGQFRKFVDETGYKTDAEKDGKGGGGYISDKVGSFPFEQRANCTWRDWGVDQSDESPVVNVSQNDAVAFCEWLSKKEGKPYGLPTEAQWEYACRAGTTTLYYNGNEPEELTRIANVADKTTKEKIPRLSWGVASSDGWAYTSPVGQFRPNNFGLYDMIGNAWELCADWYDKDYYAKSPETDPTGPAAGSSRVIRGGGWYHNAASCRCAIRNYGRPAYRDIGSGFRVASPR